MMSDRSARVRSRFWVEAVLASLTSGLFVLTLIWREWLEALGFDPDHGDGSVEWGIVAALFVAGVVLALAARTEWRRGPAAVTSASTC
jgi:hypothetical protein